MPAAERPSFTVLAGGASRRMGSDKAGLSVAGGTFLTRIAAIGLGLGLRTAVVGRPEPANWPLPGVAFVADRMPGCGPLAALADALAWAQGAVLVVGCDMPALTPAALRWLELRWQNAEADAVVAERDGEAEPLCAIYGAACRPLVSRALDQSRRSLQALLAHARVVRCPVPAEHATALTNVNTPEDLRQLRIGA